MHPDDLSFYSQMTLIRQTEEAFFALYERGLLSGTVHTSIGQEACAVGVAAALRRRARWVWPPRWIASAT